jgi:hypothetical protein
MAYTDKQLIQILNDIGGPLAEVGRQAAARLQELTAHRDDPNYLNRPARCHEYFGDDENVGC